MIFSSDLINILVKLLTELGKQFCQILQKEELRIHNMMFREKREYSRVEVAWPVNISAPQLLIQGTMINMSLGGAYIRLEELPNMNQNLSLSIEIPEYQYAVFATGETIRFEIEPSENNAVSYGLGVRLKDMTEDDLEFLSTTVLR